MILVCFTKKDVDTLFPQKTIRQNGKECQSGMLSCISVMSYRALMWLGRDPHSLQVWILVGTWDTQTAHHEGPVCFLAQCRSEHNGHIFPTMSLIRLLSSGQMLCLIHELLSNEGQIPGKQELNQTYYLAPIPLLHSTFFTLTLISPRAINEIYHWHQLGRGEKEG